jgi:muramoyltetrapeptide carboxypeptidase
MLFSATPPELAAEARPVVPGRAQGRLAGGNLATVAALVGTPFAVPARGAILFLEETEEAPYRIDRMLTQLALAGALAASRGVLVGRCTKCSGPAPTHSADEVIAGSLQQAARPAAVGAPIDHIPQQWVVPIGARAELDATAGRLRLLEAACGPRPRWL